MCCGQQRKQYRTANPVSRLPLVPAGGKEPLRASTVKFEYSGRNSLTLRGATGTTYHFERPGFQVEVDLRDVDSLVAVPNLTQILRRE